MKKFENIEALEMLRQVRKTKSQKSLAVQLGNCVRTISRWESGETVVPRMVIPALKGILEKDKKIEYKQKSNQKEDFTFIDLFAGIGGIRIGFESQGGKCVFTSEWDDFAQKTYRDNFGEGHPIAGDITQVDAKLIPDHDVLLAGFPCQPFSIAGVSKKNSLGKPHGFECATQGTLFFDVARILAEKKPKAFLLENVKNLVSHDKGNTFKVIRETLEELGYHISWRVMDGKRFVPQHRERIIIVGFLNSTEFDLNKLELPELSEKSPRMKDILHKEDGSEVDQYDGGRYIDEKGKVEAKYVLSNKLWEYLQNYAAKHKAKGNGFGCSVVGKEDTSRTLSARYYKDGSEILIDRGKGKNPRRLTPRECARLMGYPPDFQITVSDTRAYKQFGNSVVVPLIEHVAKAMRPWIIGEKQKRRNDNRIQVAGT
jgi:DNA (cytosine-5)-methyltransferase 1